MPSRPLRVGLVLGAGGVAGGAFHAGALAALEEVTGFDPRRATIVVGTSAGSIAGTGLRAGLSASDGYARATGGRLSPAGARLLSSIGPPPTPPRLRVGTTAPTGRQVASVLARAAARPFSTRASAVVSALLPEGPVATALITDGVSAFLRDWPAQPLWLCAVDRTSGRRVVFGRDSRPPLPSAVAASCAIPGVFAPVEIDGVGYVDGGAHSPTNADVLRAEPLDLVIVSSPMSIAGRSIRLRADEALRRWSRANLDTEALRLRRAGIPVIALQPTADDAAVMGVNAMDPSRRGAIARAIHQSATTHLRSPRLATKIALLTG